MVSVDKIGCLHYHRLPDDFSKDEKLTFLSQQRLDSVDWQRLRPNTRHTWLRSDSEDEFAAYMPIGSKEAKRANFTQAATIFHQYSLGVSTNRDYFVYGYQRRFLSERVKEFIKSYNLQVALYKAETTRPEVDHFVDYESIKWSSTLKRHLESGRTVSFANEKACLSTYRPYSKRWLYYDRTLVDRPGQWDRAFPNAQSETENRVICLPNVGVRGNTYAALVTNYIPNLNLTAIDGHQCFPFYTYDPDGSNRRENITDWALAQFRERYSDPNISKWDIFFYVYALLHHPGYRQRYALDLKRSLPRIPFVPAASADLPPKALGGPRGVAFHAYARAGRQLADLHLTYESAQRYPLEWQTRGRPDYRVEKMRPINKRDAETGGYKVFDALKYNDSLTLRGIPERAFAYRLGNRAALDWIVDQYRVKPDKRSGITHDPNGFSDDAQYVLKLVERVITVSLGTVDIVVGLGEMEFR